MIKIGHDGAYQNDRLITSTTGAMLKIVQRT